MGEATKCKLGQVGEQTSTKLPKEKTSKTMKLTQLAYKSYIIYKPKKEE
jgi:hypothetical protein